jgi:asparagine synthase (glutamine-hydrolysing)
MKDRLAPDLLDRSKQGFSIPLAEWLRGGLREYAADRLLDPHAFSRRFVRPAALRRLWGLHQSGEDYGSELWNLLMLELWGTVYFKHAREAPNGAATAAQPLFSPNSAVRSPVEAGSTPGSR